jgi:hypothetical protein
MSACMHTHDKLNGLTIGNMMGFEGRRVLGKGEETRVVCDFS